MKTYIGIDLGTTNSAICTFDGSDTRIWKSPEQNDVTPSAIYYDRRSKYVGKRAYDSAPYNPDNAAILFKRYMGTSTPIKLSALNLTKTPEECSAEILKTLYGYLPEEVRNDLEVGTVITVPAAFNQMQKDATLQASVMAGIGMVSLMQEPVAAVMSVMRTRKTDGMFLVYDLGGGTLDVAIADSQGGRVMLLAHGGIAMCGGRDFDRALMDNVVRPWLLDNFDLPEDLSINPKYKTLLRLATWASERTKIELSSRDEAVISLSEADTRVRDLSNNEIYLDIPIKRDVYDSLIAERIKESIQEARETLSKAHLSPSDIERIVFIGGPTNYKPLRDKVSFELGIPGSTEVNPMTAVAEGASVFAESIDWNTQNRSRKNTRGRVTSSNKLDLTFNYIARTPDVKAKVVAQMNDRVPSGSEFQIDSIDTGWTSGRQPLRQGATVDITLTKNGENVFKVFVFDSLGAPITLEQNKIIIVKTAATIDAIPASHSIGVEILERLGGRPVLDHLVKSGDQLPKKGQKVFKAAESLKAGSTDSINLKLWEGEIDDPITDNELIGVMKIYGTDFDEGVIPAGADLVCDYEMLDSGNIILEISVPCIGNTFHSGRNFYSRQDTETDFSSASEIILEESQKTLARIDDICERVSDPKLDRARQMLESAASIQLGETEPEKAKEAMQNIQAARRVLAQVNKEHRKEIRKIDLDLAISFFDKYVRKHARPSECTAFENLVKTIQRSIDQNDNEFEFHFDELRQKNFEILWRQDWFVVERFKWLVDSSAMFSDKNRFDELEKQGIQLMRSDEIDKLRSVVIQLSSIRISSGSDNEIYELVNIIRG